MIEKLFPCVEEQSSLKEMSSLNFAMSGVKFNVSNIEWVSGPRLSGQIKRSSFRMQMRDRQKALMAMSEREKSCR